MVGRHDLVGAVRGDSCLGASVMRRHHEAVTATGLNLAVILGGLYVPVIVNAVSKILKGK